MRFVVCALLVLSVSALAAAAGPKEDPWSAELDTFLARTVADGAWPGVVAAVFDEKRVHFQRAVGRFTYGIAPPESPGTVPKMTTATVFDMASCTKLMATTTAVAALYERGLLDLDRAVAHYLPAFANNGKGAITVRNVLLHNSGLKADPVPSYTSTKFGCPETSRTTGAQLAFSCRDKCEAALMADTLVQPVGAEYMYSDENFMVLMNVVGELARRHALVDTADLRADCVAASPEGAQSDGARQCFFEAYTRTLFRQLGMTHTGFLPDRALWRHIAPTENETQDGYRRRQLQGEVHDSNTFAMGGISGHAGLFSDLDDVMRFMRAWLFAPAAGGAVLNATTTTLFVTQQNHSQSSRGLGWNTNADDARDHGFSHGCGTLSPRTFMHTGFTGPVICADPDRRIATVLLANRVYPDRSSADKWVNYRRDFNTLVQKIWDANNNNQN